MTTRQRQGPDIDWEAYQKALDELDRLLEEGEKGDDSDTSWQDDLPEAPDLPVNPGDTIAVVIPGGDGGRKPARRQEALPRPRPRPTKAVRGRRRSGRGPADRPGSDGDGSV
jgi:hypothetical protein